MFIFAVKAWFFIEKVIFLQRINKLKDETTTCIDGYGTCFAKCFCPE
jgi:hypothetical protein